MLVECIGNKGMHLPSALLSLGGYGSIDADYGTTVGAQYVVYAMSFLSRRSAHYCLDCEILNNVPAELLRLVDGRISRHWVFNQDSYESHGGNIETLFLWGYPDFVNSDDHRLQLFEGQKAAVGVFENYRRQMDLEFALPNVARIAESLEDGWVMCEVCIDAWQPPNRVDEMACCPSCGTIHRLEPF